MDKLVPVSDVAEAFVQILSAHGVDYVFLNPGTDTFPIQEALAKGKALGKRTPSVVLCLHEAVAMAAAHGHFMVSERPQVVLVHVDVGTQQLGGEIHNAQRGRVGIIVCAGRTPSTFESEKRGGRSRRMMWLQDAFDQGSVVRNYVKWEYELRNSENIDRVVSRAFQVAGTEPYGPVYLTLPRELMMQKIDTVRISPATKYGAASSPQADMDCLEKAADMLIQAEHPVIIAGYSGRHPRSVASLVELAETLGARVLSAEVRMNFPTTHPLCAGIDAMGGGPMASPFMKDADVILVIDHDVPFIPGPTMPKPDTKVIHIDIDPVKQDIPLWGIPTDLLIEADSSKAIPLLNDIIHHKLTEEHKRRFSARFEQLSREHEALRDEWRTLAMSFAEQRPISPEWLSYCIGQAIDGDTIILNEVVTDGPSVGRQIRRTKPGTLFFQGGSRLGWALGAGLGAKLAAPDRTVVSLMGDGSYAFGSPIAALWAASVYKAPFLSVIFNNQMYHAIKKNVRAAYGEDSFLAKCGFSAGINIAPSPDYAAIARACFAHGRMVEDPSEVLPALREALEQVRNGKPAVIDVRLEIP